MNASQSAPVARPRRPLRSAAIQAGLLLLLFAFMRAEPTAWVMPINWYLPLHTAFEILSVCAISIVLVLVFSGVDDRR